jgi:DNA-binding response OmpR family regulator
MNNYKVLILGNNENDSSEIQIALQNYGYQVMSIVQNMSKVKNRLKTFVPDIVLINNIDDINKMMIWAQYIIKEDVPCVVCTNNIDVDMIARISFIGACSLFIKPFNLLNIHATIQISLDKYKKEKNRKDNMNILKTDNKNLRQLLFGKEIVETPIVNFGKSFYFHTSSCETFYKNKKVLLTRKENRFIQLLVSNIGHTVNFEQAISYIWGQTKATENNVRTLVWRLRSKLQSDTIKTVSGVGYYVEESYFTFQNKSKGTVTNDSKEQKDSA